MPINYPASVDVLATNRQNRVRQPVDADDINDIARYANAIGAELGANPSGSYTDVAARLGEFRKSVAGVVSDASFTVTPTDGAIGINTATKQIGYRSGDVWYQRTSPAPTATYPLGTDALDNIAIGTTWPNLTPGVTGSGQTFGCQRNTIFGSLAGRSMTTDYGEVGIGYNTLGLMANGRQNIAIGDGAMGLATGGDRNIAIGPGALLNATGINFYTANTTTVNGAGQTISTTPSTLTVASTAGFASSGKVLVGTVLVSYTGLTGTTFTGATIPSGSFTPASGAGVGVAAGSFNIAIGETSGTAITTGYANVFVGASAGKGAITSDHCTYVGESAGQFLQGGSGLVVVGADSLNSATTAVITDTTVVGRGCLQSASLVTSDVVAVGKGALSALTTGTRNTCVGSQSASVTTTGGSNTTLGYAAGFNLTTGGSNTLLGAQAGQTAATTTQKNTCVGMFAGHTSSTVQNNMTLLGYGTIGTGDGAVAIGIDSGGTSAAAGANQIALGTASHHTLWKTAADPGAAALAASQFTLWLDATNGACRLMIRAKQADGTSRTAAVALA